MLVAMQLGITKLLTTMGPFGISEPGIDLIDASDIGNSDGVGVGLQQVAGIGIPGHAAQAGQGYSARTVGAWRGLTTEGPQGLVDDWSVVAGNCVKRAARCMPLKSWKSEQSTIIGRYRPETPLKTCGFDGSGQGKVSPDGVDRHGRIKANSPGSRASCAVVINLSDDATRRIKRSTRYSRIQYRRWWESRCQILESGYGAVP